MKRCWALRWFVTVFTVLVFGQSAIAIGFWIPGKVTQAPWYANNYRYLMVGNVKYTIMDQATAQQVQTKNNAVYKSGIEIQDIRRGDKVLVKAEGNRIYQIEILR